MNRTEIHIGHAYRIIRRSAYAGRGVVKTYEKQGRRYLFLVMFPDAPPETRVSERPVLSKDFVGPWTEEDETSFRAYRRAMAEQSAMEAGLKAAGFEARRVRRAGYHGDVVPLEVTFEGDTAEHVVETLLAHPRARAELTP